MSVTLKSRGGDKEKGKGIQIQLNHISEQITIVRAITQ